MSKQLNNTLDLSTFDLKAVKHEIHIFQRKLAALRKDGSTKVLDIDEQIGLIKEDKLISKEEKKTKISELKEGIKEAKAIKKDYKEEEASIVKEAKTYLNENLKPYYAAKKVESKELLKAENASYKQLVIEEKASFNERLNQIKSEGANINPEELKANIAAIKRSHKSKLFELKLAHQKKAADIKTEVHDIYLDMVRYLTSFNDDKLLPHEKIAADWERYVFRFNIKDYLLKNGLYIVMILFFLICCIISGPMGKGQLILPKNLFEILNQASPRIFLALGVAGLILLAGTDLSIGRMVGMGTVITCIFLYPGVNNAPIFGHFFDFTSIPGPLRIIFALITTIIFTTLFSAIAGFFTAKFKMHPFISTMGTQLIIFGLLAVATDSKNTGVIDIELMDSISGKIGKIFPLLLIYAILGIMIVSFIWNRTKFGKNMYAVGGNPEAASVSGISVFWVTMGVFIMAGILYGFGSFFEAARIGTAKFDTGTGYETDAIAACVVGGISFSGGIGKIRGAVIGAIIFTALTYALTFLGINPYYQYVLRGVIIIAAVALDCLKYLKKK